MVAAFGSSTLLSLPCACVIMSSQKVCIACNDKKPNYSQLDGLTYLCGGCARDAATCPTFFSRLWIDDYAAFCELLAESERHRGDTIWRTVRPDRVQPVVTMGGDWFDYNNYTKKHGVKLQVGDAPHLAVGGER